MKLTITFLLMFLSLSSFSQCLIINCPTDIVSDPVTTGCTKNITYNLPVTYDGCNSDTLIFNYSGIIDRFEVPTGIYSLDIRTWGAAGGNSIWSVLQPGGQGAYMSGTFAVTPGQVLHLLVGQAGETTAVGGGGGGTYVVDSVSQMPLIIAGGGGGASSDMSGISAVTTEDGTMESLNIIAGGVSGNGGQVCATLDDNNGGAGAGFLTDGGSSNGNTPVSTGGFGGASFLNGGAGGLPGRLDGACTEDAYGGFGGGGSTSCNTVAGGGGGGYSGGAGGLHVSNCGSANRSGGGGGGSYNTGTNQLNTANASTGNGKIEISYFTTAGITSTLISGLGSGSDFPIGTTNEVYVYSLGSETDTCSFNVTVLDSIVPEFTGSINDSAYCSSPTNIQAPSYTDNCNSTIMYNLTGATVLTGTGDASNAQFNVGLTLVEYIVTDESGNADTTSFEVTVNPLPSITIQNDSVLCETASVLNLLATPSGGIWNGLGVTGTTFDPSVTGTGTFNISYTVTSSNGCVNSAIVSMQIDDCASIQDLTNDLFSLYPNPAHNEITLNFSKIEAEFSVSILDVDGRKAIEKEFTNTQDATINVGELPSGMFFVHVKMNNAQQVIKLMKY